ncbi:hypothetical protein IKZ77_03170, partial [Candidatus Saccharibacteria bacterium]|nr:hypothetical protein [Candidatus Saccharibacteria bacterium]
MEEVGKRALGCEKIKAIRFFLAFLLLVIWIVISARDSWASDEEAVYDVSCSSRFFTITNYSVFNKDEKKSYESTGWSNCDGKELIAYGEAGKTHIMVGEYVDIIFSHAAGYALEDGGTPS